MKSGVIGLVLQSHINGKYFKGDGMESQSQATYPKRKKHGSECPCWANKFAFCCYKLLGYHQLLLIL